MTRLLGDSEPEKATKDSVDGMISEKGLKPLPKGFWDTPLDKSDIALLRQMIAPKADSLLTFTEAKDITSALKDYEKLDKGGDADKREKIEAELVEYGIDPHQVLTEDLDPKFVARLMGDPDFANAKESTPAVLL